MTKSFSKYFFVGVVSASLLSIIVNTDAKISSYNHINEIEANETLVVTDTPKTNNETPINLPYNFQDQSTGDPLNYPNSGGLMLSNPSNINSTIEYDPITGNYDISQKMGELNYRPQTYMESQEYQDYIFKKQVRDYWNARSHAESENTKSNAILPKLHVGGDVFARIFGSNTVSIHPNGSVELIFAYKGMKTDNPALPLKQRKINSFDFDEKIQLNLNAKIGDKVAFTTNYNTLATFDFENQLKLNFAGEEDDIIKKIEAGNVSMPLTGSLITGSQTLFGIKTQLQFGRLTVTSILSQQKGKKSEVEVSGGAQISPFEVAGDAYEANKHFFLAQYFRDQYNTALASLPFVNSGINISKIEVWISNSNNATTDTRDMLGFTELAEANIGTPPHIPIDQQGFVLDNTADILPYNDQNNLYTNTKTNSGIRTPNTCVSTLKSISANAMKEQINFEKFNARKLQPSEYTLNAKLGYISLNQQLNPDQVLAVAFQYTYNGNVYNVGEFSDGGIATNQVMYAKMLKSSATNTKHPMWNLMMKNIYSLGAYQINSQDFKLDILYANSQTGTYINYLPVASCQTGVSSKPLIQVVGIDKLNQQMDHSPDGIFDFMDGVTIIANNGRVIFPVVEPFGDYLASKFNSCDNSSQTFVFNQLYDSTRTSAQQFPQFNRFKLKGTYKSASGSEISLGAPNVPQGSVTVTAGGVLLTENVDYTVDYALGRVKIINEGILNSGTPIKVSNESNALFALQQKRLMAAHLDYRVNKDFNIGGTIMNLTERPMTKKVNIGDEPISNTIWGLDGNYRTEAPFLTRWIDKIPLIETKALSTITASGEFAYLIPGHSKAIGKSGNSYIDDFEGSQSTIDLKSAAEWNLASTPQGQSSLFPEGDSANSLAYGFNRAKLAWYVIDNIFLNQTSGLTPSNISTHDMSNNFSRLIPETEIFPNKPSSSGQPMNIGTLDLAYYPSERGPYNYDSNPTAISSGLESNGTLKNPENRWGGITRPIQITDFEAANIEYIQFWVMDPFNSDNPAANWNSTGDLYFDVGNISEDVLRDSYKSAENVLPAPSTQTQNNGLNLPVDSTTWGLIPTTQSLVNAFNSDPNDRPIQDIGLDGLSDGGEQSLFNSFLAKAQLIVTPSAYATISGDPSADDFHYFRGSDYDAAGLKTLERYKKYNGMEGNSPITSGNYPTSSTTVPNSEDINRDNNLSTVESYFQYHIGLKPSDFAGGVGTNYITDVLHTTGQNIKDGTSKPITWYQFKIPLKTPESKIGSIENFQSIRFIRMFFKNADKPVVLRFAKLELIRGAWRKYGFDLMEPGLYVPNDDANTQFDISSVSIEENGSKQPVNYVLPPNIEREVNAGSANLIQMNEQSLSLTVCNLEDGKSRAAYKNTNLDVRSYKKLKMYVHAEASANAAENLNNNDLQLFVRLGTDYTDNYYEYEIPLQITAPGNYNGTNLDDQYKVWPEANEMILEFEKLQNAKQQRNKDIFNGTGVNLSSEYKVSDDSRTIVVKGNPNLSAIKTIMIGIKNPKKMGAGLDDDGLQKCAQIWVNELRLSDFDEKGGWAANARVTAKLADLGTLTLSGSIYTPGFGSIENKITERKKETLKQYDISSNLELGKFLPREANINIPMYIGYSEQFITPQYNPLDPDMLLADELKDKSIPQNARDDLKASTQDYTKRNSINFTNVKKFKGKKSKGIHVYDVENWSASYSYSELNHHNSTLEYANQKNHHGGLMYNFAPIPKNYKPFSKAKIFRPKYLQLIKDINFYLLPNKLGFSTDVTRDFSSTKNRNTTGGDMLIFPSYNKSFNMNRNYELKYDITKGLKMDFIASNVNRILEPDGLIDTKEKKDIIKNRLLNLGNTTQYNHQVNINYNIPINKLPFLDCATSSVRYSGTYSWQRAPMGADTLGNTIQNSRNIQWSGQLNLIIFYNKFPYLKRINQKHNLINKTKAKKEYTSSEEVNSKSKTTKDSTKKENNFVALEYLSRILMSLKNVTATYSITDGTLLPGYAQSIHLMGMGNHFQGPTAGFIFGSQKDIRNKAITTTQDNDPNNDWLVKTPSINTSYVTTSSKNLSIRANLEPLPDFKIELTATRTESKSSSEFFRWTLYDTLENGSVIDHFKGQSPITTGNFSMSFLSYRTSFVKNGDETFQDFLDARASISLRLGAKNDSSLTTTSDGFAEGYNETSQDVLIPAFLAAYAGKNPNKVSLSEKPKVPLPNWRITYDGLSKIEAIKNYFKSFTLSNAYRSTYGIGGYQSNLLFYDPDGDGYTAMKENVSSVIGNPNFLPKNSINTITVSEQWSPLIKFDMTLNNSVMLTFEYKKDRNLSLGLTSRTVTEVLGREIVGGTGYRIKDITLSKNFKIKGKPIRSDLNLKLDLSFRKNETIMRRIVEGVSQTIGGTNIISIKVAADYIISERVNIRLFYDRIINKPIISSSFPSSNTNAGISLRLMLND